MTHQPDVRNPPVIRLLQEHRFAALAAAVLVGVGLIAVTGGLTTQSRPTHRSVYDKVQAAYFYVSYPSRQQAVATPAQMTVEVHTFLGKIEGAEGP